MSGIKTQNPIWIIVSFGCFFLIVYLVSIFFKSNNPIIFGFKEDIYISDNIWFRFGIFFLIIGIWLVFSLLLNFLGPGMYKYCNEDWADETKFYKLDYDMDLWNVVLDTHTHTKRSDGKLTLEQCVLYHLSVGFNAFVVTDHNKMPNMEEFESVQEKYKDRCILIPGIEYTTLRLHMCLVGIREWDCKKIPLYPKDQEIKDTIAKVHKLGGVVVINHYPWSSWPRFPSGRPYTYNHPTREQMYEWGVDLIECANWDDDVSLLDYKSYDFAKKHPNISPCCGTDMHEPYREPLCGWTVLKTKEFTERGIMEELRNHRTDAILKSEPIKYPITHKENPWYKIIKPFIWHGQMYQKIYLGGKISNIDVNGIISLLSYYFIVYIIFEILRFVIY